MNEFFYAFVKKNRSFFGGKEDFLFLNENKVLCFLQKTEAIILKV